MRDNDKPLSYSRQSHYSKGERGVVLILLPFLVMALLIFGTLLIDGGNLLLTRLRLQNAIDNGLVQVPMLTVATPLTLPEIKGHMEATVRANLEGANITAAQVTNLTVDADDREASISATVARPWWMASATLGALPTPSISASTKVEVPTINLAFLVDNSLAMGQISYGSWTKLDVAKDGVRIGALWLRPNVDRVAIVTAASVGVVPMPFNISNGFDMALGSGIVLGLQPMGWSNLAEGLSLSTATFDTLSNKQNDVNIVAVFTDARPNTALVRFDPSYVSSGLPQTGGGGYDYYTFVAKAEDAGGNLKEASSYMLVPSPLTGPPPFLGLQPPCQTVTDYPATTDPDVSSCFLGGRVGVLSPSGGNSYVYPISGRNFRKLTYLTAIGEADRLRDRGVTVVGIGVNLDPNQIGFTPELFDEWGGGTNSRDLSLWLLQRIAADPQGAIGGARNFPQVPGFATEIASHQNLVGKAYETRTIMSSAEAVRMLLGKVVFKVLW